MILPAHCTRANTIVLATRNQGKVRELEKSFNALGLCTVSLHDFPDLPEVQETGTSFTENALLKARAVARLTGLTAVADDSGLEVDALNGAPGIHSSRYSDDMPDLPGTGRDERNNQKLLAALSCFHPEQRSARFCSVIVACTPAGRTIVASGQWEGRIGYTPQGSNGFGYDPLFFDPQLGRTAAELSPEEKMVYSHRGKALRELLRLWPSFWEKN